MGGVLGVLGQLCKSIHVTQLAATNPVQGVAQNPSIAGTSREWQIPVGMQLVSSGALFLGMLTLPESIRWLLSKGRKEEAWKSLTWIRGDDGPKTLHEFSETQLGLQAETMQQQGFQLRELLEPANRLRFLIGPTLFVFQNATGSSALAVFAPQYFSLLAGSSGNRDLLLTGLFGAVKVIACSFFIWVLAERIGRRMTLVGGAGLMAAAMLITALIVDFIPTQAHSSVTPAGKATVAMIYIDIMVSVCFGGQPLLTSRFTIAPGVLCRGLTCPKSSRPGCAPMALR